MDNQQVDLLSDLDNENEMAFIKASSGKRVANYLIDLIGFFIFIIIFGFLIGLYSPTFFEALENANPFVDQLGYSLFFALYMGSMEAFTKGRSLGKYITKTKAVNTDGTDITFEKAFARGICRVVPFNPLSALGAGCNPWHDRWTSTTVIEFNKD